MIEFRSLRPSEIECRVGQIAKNGSGLSLLLYKNARTDCDILDEVFGLESWQCKYDVINGQLFCTVSVWSEEKGQWISKQDVGSPSNIEAEKGRASDAFKRACFKLGIGRELYTAPRIWVRSDECDIKQGANGKYQCYDSFSVSAIEISNHTIERLSVRNDDTGKSVFEWVSPNVLARMSAPPTEEQGATVEELVDALAKVRNVGADVVLSGLMACNAMRQFGNVAGIETTAQADVAIGQLRTWLENSERTENGE